MNKEIKFRAWDTHNKRMIGWHDVIFINLNKNGINTTTTQLCEYPLKHINSDSNLFRYLQFTGLLDKNDEEIFEGDILVIDPERADWYGERATYKVTRDLESWGYVFNWEHISGYECSTHIMEDNPINYEVIGNIYENPELLEDK